jgi:hypothetical protein
MLDTMLPARLTPTFGGTRYLMRLLLTRSFSAVVALTIGVFLLGSCRRSHELSIATTPTPVPSNDFAPTGARDNFMEYYRRASDGAGVQYGCYDRDSEDTAITIVRSQREAPVIEKTIVADAGGVKIGERVVWDTHGLNYAEIRWNQGARLFAIEAESLKDALTFEKSRVWVGKPCEDMRSFDQRRHRTSR